MTLPEKVLPLLTAPSIAVLAINQPGKPPHQTIVWFMWEEPYIVISTFPQAKKYTYVQVDPLVSVLIVAGDNPGRYLVVRGRVEKIVPDPDVAILDRISLLYTGKLYYGENGADPTGTNPGDMVALYIKPDRFTTVGL